MALPLGLSAMTLACFGVHPLQVGTERYTRTLRQLEAFRKATVQVHAVGAGKGGLWGNGRHGVAVTRHPRMASVSVVQGHQPNPPLALAHTSLLPLPPFYALPHFQWTKAFAGRAARAAGKREAVLLRDEALQSIGASLEKGVRGMGKRLRGMAGDLRGS